MREEERWTDKEGGTEGEMDAWGASNIRAAEGYKRGEEGKNGKEDGWTDKHTRRESGNSWVMALDVPLIC